jgi:hypothetical protein
MPPAEQLLDELGGDGMAIEEAGEDSLPEEAHQERGVPLRQGEEAAIRGEAAVGGDQVEMGVPLQEVPRGGDRDDEAGAEVASGRTADELDGRFCASPGELSQEVSPAAKERRDRLEHFPLQPLRPQELPIGD